MRKRRFLIVVSAVVLLCALAVGMQWIRQASKKPTVGETTFDEFQRMYPDETAAITSYGYAAFYTAEDGTSYTLTFRHQADGSFLLTSMKPNDASDLQELTPEP